jgi:N-acetylglucosamine kinase-like BadF-type ATPase
MCLLIADSGATKCEWCCINNEKKKIVFTQGISPYFLDGVQVQSILLNELIPSLKQREISAVHYYGTGCTNPVNVKMIRTALQKVFPEATILVDHDMMGAARALCGSEKGIACILGTGSNSCYYNGQKIVKNRPGIGYILGDEGSGAYLGKKVLQYYLYETFDEELKYRFELKYKPDRLSILENVYRKPLANRFIASYALFLTENRGHYMVENIIEDALNDFFFQHLCKYNESWKFPISFTGGVAYAFKDVIKGLCQSYEFDLGTILKNPMEGLIHYHRTK